MFSGRTLTAFLFAAITLPMMAGAAEREVITLGEGWRFSKGPNENAQEPGFNDEGWEQVTVPHDWAITGPFDKEVDKQVVRIEQNMEADATEKTGRTGALPHIGEGWYRNRFNLPELDADQRVLIQFEGAMSRPVVYVNGAEVGRWNYGYAYFYFDITDAVESGAENLLAVHLTNDGLSSRWYPGAGLYRKVQVIIKNKNSFEQWGTFITTPQVADDRATVQIQSAVTGENLLLKTAILDPDGKPAAVETAKKGQDHEFLQEITVKEPKRWSPETPHLYTAVMRLYSGTEVVDEQTIRFGIRTIEYEPGTGFSLNGKVRKFKGVCLHHDLGPLGAAVNKAALRRQIAIMKEMGCDAIRSAHNMPSMEQLELCDEMGMMFLAESFDEWARAKVKNGYNRFFREDAEKDVVNLVRATRNHPCIVMWSSGNEVPDQWSGDGVQLATWLQEIFHREDPTRPVTVGMDQVKRVMESGFGAVMDIPGLNYRTHLYDEAHECFPQGLLLGSETASTVSSRGIYKFPVRQGKSIQHDDLQCSSYDVEYCSWSNLPEEDFILQDDKPWVIGEFVWTGFDYLGEPTPYDDFWPSRSSYFGICDLAGLPKDRYYLYRSRWNTEDETLHILPHWTWPGREGETTPVYVYTSYDSAELFVNGRSMGVQKKVKDMTPQHRYRLMWDDVTYEPGTIRVVAFDETGKPAAEREIKTAGAPHRIVLEADRSRLVADGEDLAFVTVSVVDENGVPCPTATNRMHFAVSGAGTYRAACNGDATSLEMFHEPTMKLFSGKLVVLVQSSKDAGKIRLTVSADGLPDEQMVFETRAWLPPPTLSNVRYGEHERNVLDFWKAESDEPTPVVFHMHGGGWFNGDKESVGKTPVQEYLDAGISVVSINYRYVKQARAEGIEPPVKGPMMDAARALQFVRSKANAWNIDKQRIGVAGNSAGACTTLWLALHDDLADPDSDDPVARESTRVWCAAEEGAQTSLDPQQMKEWTPNSRYGGHAFDVNEGSSNDERFAYFLAHREEVLPWILEYSPIEHVSADDPPIYLIYGNRPALGERQKDPTHSANFGVQFKTAMDAVGAPCELVYPGAPDVQHATRAAFLIATLKRPEPIQIVLVGDSTMCEYDLNKPDRGWGMCLEEAFIPGSVEVHNLARGGRSTKTFIQEKRWDKALALQPDIVFIQFGHNDSHAPENPESTDAQTDYRDYLRRYIDDSRAIGATPILVTPMVRRTFHDDGTLDDNLKPYADAMKAVAAEKDVLLIDLHSSSWEFFEPLGPDGAQEYARNSKDRTHFNEQGANVISELVVRDLAELDTPLSAFLQ